MILRKEGHNFYLELRSTDALFLISELAKAVDVSQIGNFPRTFPLCVSYTEGENAQHYSHVLNVRVEPPQVK